MADDQNQDADENARNQAALAAYDDARQRKLRADYAAFMRQRKASGKLPAKLLREAEVEDGSRQPTASDHRHRRRTSAPMRRNRLRRNSRRTPRQHSPRHRKRCKPSPHPSAIARPTTTRTRVDAMETS